MSTNIGWLTKVSLLNRQNSNLTLLYFPLKPLGNKILKNCHFNFYFLVLGSVPRALYILGKSLYQWTTCLALGFLGQSHTMQTQAPSTCRLELHVTTKLSSVFLVRIINKFFHYSMISGWKQEQVIKRCSSLNWWHRPATPTSLETKAEY